ncbi:MAG: SurA N-terminal domain-containing protein [Patescibacteria group bacterium]
MQDIQSNSVQPQKNHSTNSTKSAIQIILGILVVCIIVVGGYFLYTKNSAQPETTLDILDVGVPEMAMTQHNDSDTIATVNGVQISFGELKGRLALQLRLQGITGEQSITQEEAQVVLEGLIDEELIFQEAKNQGFAPTQEQIQTELDTIKTQYATPAEFESALESNNTTEQALLTTLERQLTFNRFVEEFKKVNDFSVTDEEVQIVYDQVASTQEDLPALEDVKPQVIAQIEQEKIMQAIKIYTQNLRAEVDVQTML